MSYCVNCGVELDKTAEFCPLCNTVVINLTNPPDLLSKPPYPVEKGSVENLDRKGLAIFLTVVFAAIAVACLMLNLFLFKYGFWSAYAMGACLICWIFTVPAMILRPSLLLVILLDGAGIAFYCYVIAMQTASMVWYYQIALPIIIAITGLLFLYAYVTKRFKTSILLKTAYVFAEVGILNVVIELSIRHMLDDRFYIRWSAVVLTCCTIVVIALITVMRQKNLRDVVQKRLHF